MIFIFIFMWLRKSANIEKWLNFSLYQNYLFIFKLSQTSVIQYLLTRCPCCCSWELWALPTLYFYLIIISNQSVIQNLLTDHPCCCSWELWALPTLLNAISSSLCHSNVLDFDFTQRLHKNVVQQSLLVEVFVTF